MTGGPGRRRSELEPAAWRGGRTVHSVTVSAYGHSLRHGSKQPPRHSLSKLEPDTPGPLKLPVSVAQAVAADTAQAARRAPAGAGRGGGPLPSASDGNDGFQVGPGLARGRLSQRLACPRRAPGSGAAATS